MDLNQTLSKVGSAIVTADSDEVDDLKWYKIGEVDAAIKRKTGLYQCR